MKDLDIKFKDYVIRRPTYLDGREPDKWCFDVCKYNSNKTTVFVIGTFYWNPGEPCWEFESCATRYLEHYSDGLNEWLLKVMAMFECEIYAEDNSDEQDWSNNL